MGMARPRSVEHLGNPRSVSAPLDHYWVEFSNPARLAHLSHLVEHWHEVGFQIALHLFASLEADRRASAKSRVPQGMISWEDGDLILLIWQLFEAYNLPDPRLTRRSWSNLWAEHDKEARNGIDPVRALSFCEGFCSELLLLATWPETATIETTSGASFSVQAAVKHERPRAHSQQAPRLSRQKERPEPDRLAATAIEHQREAPAPSCPRERQEADRLSATAVGIPREAEWIHSSPARRVNAHHSWSPAKTKPSEGSSSLSCSNRSITVPVTNNPPRQTWDGRRPPFRMLLTSSGLNREPFRQAFVGLLRSHRAAVEPKVLYVADAGVGNGFEARSLFSGFQQQMLAMGVNKVECIELRQTTQDKLARQLEGVDCIYVDSGNTFYLRYYMRTSGFDILAPPLVREGGVMYVGASAGSMCAGRTISVAFWKGWDNPGYGQEWDLSPYGYAGLDLVPASRSVFPHFGQQWQQLVDTKCRELDHRIVVLDEDHAYVACGDREELIPAVAQRVPAPLPAPHAATESTLHSSTATRMPSARFVKAC